MAYRDNVSQLAREMRVSNDPKLDEKDLTILSPRFFSSDGRETVIDATDMNRGGRLFIQAMATITVDRIPCVKIPCDEHLRTHAAKYFAELWEESTEPGKRPLLNAIRHYDFIAITYK